MKKILAAVVSVLLVAAMAVSFAACSKGDPVKVIDVSLSGEPYGYCYDKENKEIEDAINQLIFDLCGSQEFNPEIEGSGSDAKGVLYDYDGDGTPETVTFKDLYEYENGNNPVRTVSALTEVPNGEEDNCLVVATNAAFPPFEDVQGDKFSGIDMQIAQMLANRLGKKLVIRNMEFDVIIKDVETGKSDIGMAGFTISKGREELVTFSNPYYRTSQRIAVLKSETAFDNCKTEADVRAVIEGMGKVKGGAADGQTGYYYLAGSDDFGFEKFENVEIKGYSEIALAVKDLSNGKVKFVVGDRDTINDAVDSINDTL